MNKGGIGIASINLFFAGLIVLLSAGWVFIQKGCNRSYQREANAFFEKIESKEIKHKNINNKHLPFNFKNSLESLKKLKIDPSDAEYYDYSVTEIDKTAFRIIARLKPEFLKKWYYHNPETKFRIIYEKRSGQKGRLIEQ